MGEISDVKTLMWTYLFELSDKVTFDELSFFVCEDLPTLFGQRFLSHLVLKQLYYGTDCSNAQTFPVNTLQLSVPEKKIIL